ncbi:hypothetical protein KKA13_02255, partial [Patescibacteria group bacterium]|nr:hypothetical protein [Patescibacteria group bacterium]
MHQKFAWTKKYSVGVAEIDKQHKEFIKICNGLLDLAKEKSFTLEEVKIKIMRLGDYALYHFGTEEELFIKTKYPDASPHTKAHLQFRDKVKDYIKHAQQKI